MTSTSLRPAPPADDLLQEILEGLQSAQPTLPCKLFYDERGSQLYDQITELDVYYPFAAEVDILQRHGQDIAAALGEGALVVEYGSGSSVKTRLLLDALRHCAGYIPIDISREHLLAAAGETASRYPQLQVDPLCADFTATIDLPARWAGNDRRVAFFPGSTIGNFDADGAIDLLRNIRALVGARGQLLIGVDVPKDRAALELAYDDPQGVTAAFNLNILDHVNALFGADFDTGRFHHEAVWNEDRSRVEMHLRCTEAHHVTLAGTRLHFPRGQSIWTESSYKYRPDMFCDIAAGAGFRAEQVWFDSARRYSLHLMQADL